MHFIKDSHLSVCLISYRQSFICVWKNNHLCGAVDWEYIIVPQIRLFDLYVHLCMGQVPKGKTQATSRLKPSTKSWRTQVPRMGVGAEEKGVSPAEQSIPSLQNGTPLRSKSPGGKKVRLKKSMFYVRFMCEHEHVQSINTRLSCTVSFC